MHQCRDHMDVKERRMCSYTGWFIAKVSLRFGLWCCSLFLIFSVVEIAFEWRLITFSGLALGWFWYWVSCWILYLHCCLSPPAGYVQTLLRDAVKPSLAALRFHPWNRNSQPYLHLFINFFDLALLVGIWNWFLPHFQLHTIAELIIKSNDWHKVISIPNINFINVDIKPLIWNILKCSRISLNVSLFNLQRPDNGHVTADFSS